MFKSREIHHTKNKELRETERNETEKISTETENQTNWAFIKIHKKKDIVFEKRRQKHLDTPSRSQQSPQLMAIDQLRDYKQT